MPSLLRIPWISWGWTPAPRWHSGKESACQCRRCKRWSSIPGLGRSPGVGDGNPLQCSCLENPRDGGAWWAAVDGVAQSRTRLKRLSSSSNLEAHNLSNILCLSGLSVQRDRGQFKLTQVNQGNLLAQVTRKESISFRHSLI